VYLPVEREYNTVDVFHPDSLAPGANVGGTAIVEGANMTMFVPDECEVSVDQFGNYRITRTAAASNRRTTTMITEE
jgi:N-methylhydantoinase A/oxoprolinase/acetone carboxylase beta subunit